MHPNIEHRSARRKPDVLRKGVWAVAILCTALAVWCADLILGAHGLREEVMERVVWTSRADDLRRELSDVVQVTEGDAHDLNASDALREALRSGDLLLSGPEEVSGAPGVRERWIEHAEGLLAVIENPASDETGSETTLVVAVAHREGLDTLVRDLEDVARAGLVMRAAKLDRFWSSMSFLAVAALLATFASGLLLLRYRAKDRDLRASRRALKNGKLELESLIQAVHDLIWRMNEDLEWVFVNQASVPLYGCSPDEVMRHGYVDFVAPERVAADEKVLRAVIEDGTPRDFQSVHVRRDGRRVHVRVHATAVRDATGKVIGISGTTADITLLQQMQESQVHSQRLQALGTLASGIAHDFGNLLTAALGYCHLASETAHDPKETREALLHLESALANGRSLTQPLLAFSRRQPLTFKVAELGAVLHAVDRLSRRVLPEEVQLLAVTPSGPVFARVDPGQIEQVLLNLAVNARDALPDGGSITFSLSVRNLEREDASVLGIVEGSWAVLEVNDDGVGMDAQTLSRAFDPFFTTKKRGKGTGLGLATVHGIVLQHGGTVTVKSREGHGTTVSVYLPTVPEPTMTTTPQIAAQPMTTRGFLSRIAVVEDDEGVLKVIAESLRAEGFEALAWSNPEEAAKVLVDDDAEIDALVVDVRMPRISGGDLASRARRLRPELPVLFISGYTGDSLDPAWRDAFAVSFLAKPFSSEQLVSRLRSLLVSHPVT